MSLFKNIKQSWNDFLDRLAKNNQKNYGSGVPDCCKLNKAQNDASQGKAH